MLLQSPIFHLKSLLLQSPLFPASSESVAVSEKPVPVTAKSSGCLSTYWEFPAVLVLVMLYSNVLTLKSSGTLVLSPVPLKKWIRSPLSIRSFREICSSSGSEEESVFMQCEFTVFENAADPLPLSSCQVP